MPEITHDLDDLPTDFLKCRTFGHAWEEYVPVGMRKPTFGFRYSLLCASCGTERHDLIDTNGGLVQREYRYPDGYRLSFWLDRATARLALQARGDRQRLARRGDTLVRVVG